MKNYYKVLNIQRTASTSEIKQKTKELLKEIKKSNLTTEKKNQLSKEVFESFEFLNDYHKRRSLDDYLESQYKILSKDDKPLNNGIFTMMPFAFDVKNFDQEIDKININNNNDNSYFFSSSSITTNEMDKDGNIVTKTKKYTNDNGKKDKKEYSKKTKIEDVERNLNNLIKETFKF